MNYKEQRETQRSKKEQGGAKRSSLCWREHQWSCRCRRTMDQTSTWGQKESGTDEVVSNFSFLQQLCSVMP